MYFVDNFFTFAHFLRYTSVPSLSQCLALRPVCLFPSLLQSEDDLLLCVITQPARQAPLHLDLRNIFLCISFEFVDFLLFLLYPFFSLISFFLLYLYLSLYLYFLFGLWSDILVFLRLRIWSSLAFSIFACFNSCSRFCFSSFSFCFSAFSFSVSARILSTFSDNSFNGESLLVLVFLQ